MKKFKIFYLLESTIENIGWVQIFISPFLLGLLISAFIYFTNPNIFTLIIACFISASAFIIGLKLASKIKKEKGTINFLSGTKEIPNKNDLKIQKK